MPKVIPILLFIFAYLFCNSYSSAATVGKIAIIIDDIGNHKTDVETFTELPSSVVFSILPFTPFAKKVAKVAHQQNREVLLHIPMQAHSHNHLLGRGALTQEMNQTLYQKALKSALIAVPYAIGVNNHMGSKLTEESKPMKWTMELLYQQGFFFVDSRTSPNSVAESSALIAGLPALRRHVFLDNIRTQEAMEKQFQEAIKHSLHSPHTIIIAHPYAETLEYLTARLSQPSEHYQLVPLSQLIAPKQYLTLQRKKIAFQQANLITPETNTIQLQ